MRQFPPRQAQPSEVVLLFSLCVCVVVSVCVATVAKQDSSVNFFNIFFEHFRKKLSPCEATRRSPPGSSIFSFLKIIVLECLSSSPPTSPRDQSLAQALVNQSSATQSSNAQNLARLRTARHPLSLKMARPRRRVRRPVDTSPAAPYRNLDAY